MPDIDPYKIMDEAGTGAADLRVDITLGNKDGLDFGSIQFKAETSIGQTCLATFWVTNDVNAQAPSVGDVGWHDVTALITAVGTLGAAQTISGMLFEDQSPVLQAVKGRLKIAINGGTWTAEARVSDSKAMGGVKL